MRVWWPLDEVWYEGIVHAKGAGNNGKGHSLYIVHYDDGTVENKLDLTKETFEWLGLTQRVSSRSRIKLREGGLNETDLEMQSQADGTLI